MFIELWSAGKQTRPTGAATVHWLGVEMQQQQANEQTLFAKSNSMLHVRLLLLVAAIITHLLTSG